jgi:DNA-binding NarL/FixJ family response regulator
VGVSRARILIADDNSAVLKHVSKVLRRDYEVVAALEDGSSVLKECAHYKPDVIVLDISMGDPSGIDVARTLRDRGCRSKIIFLTVHEDADYVNAAMGAGGSGYVVKSRMNAELVHAVKAVLAGKLFVSGILLHEQP